MSSTVAELEVGSGTNLYDLGEGEPSPFEPIAVEPQYENPRATVDPDQSKHWVARVMPIVLASKWLFASAIGFSIITMLMNVSVPALIGKTIDAIAPALTEGQSDDLFFFLGVVFAVGVARLTSGYFSRYHLQRVSNQIEADLRSTIYNHLVTLSFSFYDKIQTGQVISRANFRSAWGLRF